MHVLCVTPNISIDRTVGVPGFGAGKVWRTRRVSVACGGKGVNVARAITALGHQATSAGLIAGHLGRLAADLAEAERLRAVWTEIEGETRVCVIVVDDNGATTVINEPGPPIANHHWSRFERDVAAAATAADTVCISGSLPPGCPRGGLAGLIAAARGDGSRPVWVDTSMPALAEAAAAGPVAIRINADEAAALLGHRPLKPLELLRAARTIAARCGGPVAITDGGAPAVLVSRENAWQAVPPPIDLVSAVGSGDCFLAALMVTLTECTDPGAALRRAVAAGAANARHADAGAIDAAEVARLTEETRVVRLDG
ncbi:MAG: hexose kinase [Rhodospirillales bacterium]|nr:hexose kinase [Rhodospirillales bacterium]